MSVPRSLSVVASSSPTSADQALTLTVLRDAEVAGARLEAIADRTGGGQSREIGRAHV